MRKLPNRRNLVPPIRRQLKSLTIQNQCVHEIPPVRARPPSPTSQEPEKLTSGGLAVRQQSGQHGQSGHKSRAPSKPLHYTRKSAFIPYLEKADTLRLRLEPRYGRVQPTTETHQPLGWVTETPRYVIRMPGVVGGGDS